MKIDTQAHSGPKTFARGLAILEELYKAGDEGLKITDIAALTNIHRPTVYRFLDVLTNQGFAVEVVTDARRFVFNFQKLNSITQKKSNLDCLKLALKRISLLTGNSSFLICREGGISHCIHRETGSYPVQVLAVPVGHRQPLGVGAAGLALLSSSSQESIDLILALNKDQLSHFGGMTEARMRQLIQNTQERGWSVVGNAVVPGIVGVGIPILEKSGQPIFGVSVSSTLERMSLEEQRRTVAIMRAELAELPIGSSKQYVSGKTIRVD